MTALAISPSGDTLAVGQVGRNVVLLFDAASGAELGLLHGHGGGLLHQGAVNALAFDGGGGAAPTLASGSDDKTGAGVAPHARARLDMLS